MSESTVDHPTPRDYLFIALILAVITAAEVAVTYADALDAVVAPLLIVMSGAKFTIVVGYFMHLKFDSPIFKGVFYLGLFLAVVLFGIMLTTFHFFIT